VTLDQAGNRLGALALVVTDRMEQATPSEAVALSALHHFLDRPSVDLLRQVLGLTSSGTVRLVDRLAVAGYVRRVSAGGDGRETRVELTAAGRRAAARVAGARARALDDAVAPLSATERATFDALVSKLLVGLMRAGRDPLDVPPLRHPRLRPRPQPVPGGERGATALRLTLFSNADAVERPAEVGAGTRLIRGPTNTSVALAGRHPQKGVRGRLGPRADRRTSGRCAGLEP
jgi:DNA-binding MarR family transcriptional regulator